MSGAPSTSESECFDVLSAQRTNCHNTHQPKAAHCVQFVH